ncbi:MAG: YggS family pyridoxal phosphate-dependent enzyme [Spirochaetales bacterium]|nr:YggS family pyridoxal phosphate-dependent enzyme [Spirochaetales bacterium]
MAGKALGAYGFVAERVAELRERMAAAAARSGRDPGALTLMAVSKFHPAEAALAAFEAGVRVFGESRVQEALAKFGAAGVEGDAPGSDRISAALERGELELHLIGTLQSNKAKKAAELFSCVQSVHSVELARELSKRALAAGRRLDVLLELHTAEESKSGFPGRDALLSACDELAGLEGLRVRGLMTMAPWTREETPVRASFRTLAAAFREIAVSGRFDRFDTLSMGMTNDYEIAIEEGSTLVRVGTALFGERGAGRAP